MNLHSKFQDHPNFFEIVMAQNEFRFEGVTQNRTSVSCNHPTAGGDALRLVKFLYFLVGK